MVRQQVVSESESQDTRPSDRAGPTQTGTSIELRPSLQSPIHYGKASPGMKIIKAKARERENEGFWEGWYGTRIGKLSAWCYRLASSIRSALSQLGLSALFYFGWAIIISIDVVINRHRVHGTDW